MKKIISLVLCVGLLSSLFVAFAANEQPPLIISPAPAGARAMTYVQEKGFMTGVAENEFAPNLSLTRAMAAVIIWRMAGEPICGQGKSGTFADVEEYAWYTEAVEWCAAFGIANGMGGVEFKPHENITREQFAAMLYRYEQFNGGGFKGMWMFRLPVSDIAEISEWSFEAICWLFMKNIIPADENSIINPKGEISRAEAAEMIMSFCEAER